MAKGPEDRRRQFRSIKGGIEDSRTPPGPDEKIMLQTFENTPERTALDIANDIVANFTGDPRAALATSGHQVPDDSDSLYHMLMASREKPDLFPPDLAYALAAAYIRQMGSFLGPKE